MSAIAGIFSRRKNDIDIEKASNMMACFKKYPANAHQTIYNNKIFFGCHAQWITPESINERNPYYDKERKLAITADAIIDNRDELFDLLQVERKRRNSIGDCELILLAYDKWGEQCLQHLIGDYAFVIWDERNNNCFAARDFSGTRTLYYFYNDDIIVFSTTIEPLFCYSEQRKILNENWLAEYLAITAVVDTANASITPYQNIYQVQPSHSIFCNENKVKEIRYCSFQRTKKMKFKSDHEYVEAFHDVFQQAVKSKVRTFRKIGSHLSGGLDSGSVVSFAAKELQSKKQSLMTFSYIPPADFTDFTPKHLVANEKPNVQSTVRFVGGVKDFYFDFNQKDSYSMIDGLVSDIEMPYKYFENSFWVKGMFEEAQKRDIGILLSGGRGNFTISWGHALSYYALLVRRLRWIRLAKELHMYSQRAGGARFRRIPTILKLAFPSVERMFSNNSYYTLPTIIDPAFAERTNVYEKLKKFGIGETGWFQSNDMFELRIRHFQDVFHWNATNTLDCKLSLQHGVWKRDPTNDKRVIQFCLSVPEEQYVQDGIDRALIRRATEHYLPNRIRLNQKNRGVQGTDWLHRMKPHWEKFLVEVDELKEDEELFKYVNAKVIEQARENIATREFDSNDAVNTHIKLLMRTIILSRFIKTFS
ncbi:asparagine synthase-related protein [Alkalihalobacterium bogoriense]|uniref:asparagine synthase-related protein n=1 Tax=Alkalihalobacterium bogoriense TaxID=246272 RepID=UPI00047BEE90|nr:asparagine synthase-related protein [Alkalihalobacterium bogoriense]